MVSDFELNLKLGLSVSLRGTVTFYGLVVRFYINKSKTRSLNLSTHLIVSNLSKSYRSLCFSVQNKLEAKLSLSQLISGMSTS